MDATKHELAVEVKGATCTNLSVRNDEHGRWFAQ
jgi:SHS2 domain-containing protein